ncbi:hypothetical protein Tsubulata_019928 [Turnera subulata]|uniref:Preprotein translocase subunit SECE1 n=1 Tax=Turnera subulata TaxID=218843 RepID=A0A9Q0FF01_9ROSI|nr:hypothetical protein Tsubulata_019928 [Turnera subulata]
MALTLSLKLPATPPPPPLPLKPSNHPNPNCLLLKPPPVSISFNLKARNRVFVARAVEEGGGTEAVKEEGEPTAVEEPSEVGSELGAEIKKAMMERKANEAAEGGGGLWSGVAEEVQEIEWPAFGKVLGTTGVVLGVIAGSSVVLLTVNAVLAELSDRVFAGRGIQDFF